jgi:filamentous hemagglutinin family protein
VSLITGGTLQRTNLFHSFDRFILGTGETARFTSVAPRIDHIISRVTGGQPSLIDGLLQSDIPGANLYLLNPSGILFGPNASLDVHGSFYASTADVLRFVDGASFFASTSPESVLTVAPPMAFGFLGPHPAGIALQGSVLQVSEGQTLSITGGDVTIAGGFLSAPSGMLHITSTASPGETLLAPAASSGDVPLPTSPRLGQVELSQGTLLSTSGHGIPGLGGPGGTIRIQGGRLLIDQAFMVSDTMGAADGARQAIDLHLPEEITVARGSQLVVAGFGAGRVGSITLQTGRLHLTDGAVLESETFGPGHAGGVSVTATEAATIAGQDSEGLPSRLSSIALGDGEAGPVTLTAPTVGIDGGLVGSITIGAGRGGDVAIHAEEVTLLGGGLINNITFSPGQGGAVTVDATASVTISGHNSDGVRSGIANTAASSGDAGQVVVSTPVLRINEAIITTGTTDAGRAGDIALHIGRLELQDGGIIDSSTSSSGQGGMLTINAAESITIASGGDRGLPSLLFSATIGSGDAGRITISAPTLIVDDGRLGAFAFRTGRAGEISLHLGDLILQGSERVTLLTLTPVEAGLFGTLIGGSQGSQSFQITGTAQISSTSFGAGPGGPVNVEATNSIAVSGANSGFFSNAEGSGAGGSISIQAPHIGLRKGAVISARSTGMGNAGNLMVTAQDTLQIEESALTTEAVQADGGNITLTVKNLLRLRASAITATVGGGRETVGGNITIDPAFVVLTASQIAAEAFAGQGGTIRIATDVFLADPPSRVSASSALGIDGIVDIRAPVTEVRGVLTPLPTAFAPTITLLSERCAPRLWAGQVSQLVVRESAGVPASPGGFLPGILADVAPKSQSAQQTTTVAHLHPQQAVPEPFETYVWSTPGDPQPSLDTHCSRW